MVSQGWDPSVVLGRQPLNLSGSQCSLPLENGQNFISVTNSCPGATENQMWHVRRGAVARLHRVCHNYVTAPYREKAATGMT